MQSDAQQLEIPAVSAASGAKTSGNKARSTSSTTRASAAEHGSAVQSKSVSSASKGSTRQSSTRTKQAPGSVQGPVLAALNEDESQQLAVSNAIRDISLGLGIIHLVDAETRNALGLDAPALVANAWNVRDASDAAVNKLWAQMNHGEWLEWHSIEHAVVVGVQSKDQLSPTWVSNPSAFVQWAPNSKNTTMININGNHRRALVQSKLIGSQINPLIEVSPNYSTDRRKELQKQLLNLTRWLAQIIDLSAFEKLSPSLQVAVKDALCRNQIHYIKPDSFFERLANNSTPLLRIGLNKLIPFKDKLQSEINSIPETNKAQRGILFDAVMVYTFAILVRFRYFSSANLFKLETLNASRSFSGSMIWPAVSLHAKFYLSLTLPTPNPTSSLSELQKYLNKLDPLNPSIKPSLLTPSFFSKLDELFKRLLFDSFQTFMNSTAPDTYFQDKVPVLDSDAENSDSEVQDESHGTVVVSDTATSDQQLIQIGWQERYRNSYIKSVIDYMQSYVKFNAELCDEADEIQALKLMPGKVAFFLKAFSEDTSIMPTGSFWMASSTPLPLVTPSFLNAFLGSLNAIEDAVLAVSVFLEPMTEYFVKIKRGDKAKSVVEVLHTWIESGVQDSEKSHKVMQLILRVLLANRDTGLADLHRYLQKNKLPAVSSKDLTPHYLGKEGVNSTVIDSLKGLPQQAFYLNSFFYEAAQDKIKGGTSDNWVELLRKVRKQHFDKSLFTTHMRMIMLSQFDWGLIKVQHMSSEAPSLSAFLLKSHLLALHIWEAFEKHPSIYNVYLGFKKALQDSNTDQSSLWAEQDSWTLDESKEVKTTENDKLSYLAPLQQNAAQDVKESTEKQMVTRINRIVADSAWICAAGGKIPDDVNSSLKPLVMQLGYYALLQIKKYESVNDLKSVDLMNQLTIDKTMQTYGVKTKQLEEETISRAAWKKALTMPSHKELQGAVKKRLRLPDSQEPAKKKQKKDRKGKGKAKAESEESDMPESEDEIQGEP